MPRLRLHGAAAHAFCRTQARSDATIATACRRQGDAADLPHAGWEAAKEMASHRLK